MDNPVAPVFEDIAHPANRVDQLPLKRVVHLLPQPLDLDVHRVRLEVEIGIPDVLDDGGPRQHLPGAAGEQGEKCKLLGP
jgi:hypothetical protein